MRRFFHFLGRSTGLTRDPAALPGGAERPLRVLLVASVVIPATLFLVAAGISYDHHYDEAVDRLQRNLGIVDEHARKVFETFDLSERYLDQVVGDATDQQIRAAEAVYSARLRILTDTLPQLRDLWIIDAAGYPVVSGTVFPMPQIDLSDREYFSVHKNNRIEGLYVTELLDARAADLRFFAISRKRMIDGRFGGVTIISIAPEYFIEFYAKLPPPSVAFLLRQDGALLARYPDASSVVRHASPEGRLMTAIRAQPDRGLVIANSPVDNQERIFSYRKLPRLPIYVFAATDVANIREEWLAAMSEHLIFGIPATLAMFGLGIMALHRTRRLQQEVERRESTEQALRQSQKMEAVGRLSGGIAHDFNNMLTVILGNIDMALQRIGEDNPRIHRLLDSARQASERAAMLVQRLLAFSRQHPQEVKAVDINRLVQGMSELLRRTIGETVTVETVLAGGLWKIAVDPNQLENAVINLAVNARDAMPDGGRLTIETTNSYLDEVYASTHGGEIEHGQFVMVAVSDTGTGMSQEVIERAFEPFFTTKPTGMGTGLGLSMVYGFAKQSGGHIKIYSEIGEGTTIKMYFPRLSEQRGLPDWSNNERTPAKSAAAPRGTETVLLVEDDEEVNRFACGVLREQGYHVHAAPDAANALRLLDADPKIALLFTDVVLPGGTNGRQLADEALRRRPGLKVLYATGYTRNAIIHHGRLDADVELLTKPFAADALIPLAADWSILLRQI